MNKPDSYNEKLLISRVADGDEKAFGIIVNLYWKNIYSQALTYVKSTHLAQDIVQDVFLKVWEKRQALTNIDRFDSYLFIIARNLIISGLRKKLTMPLNNDMQNFTIESSCPDTMYSHKQLNEVILKAIDLLPKQQKTTYLLSRNEGLNYEAIAAQMELSKETVKKHIGRALNFLRTYISMHAELGLLLILPSIIWFT